MKSLDTFPIMKEVREDYLNNGFVVIPSVFTESKIDELLLETVRLCREEGSQLPKTHVMVCGNDPYEWKETEDVLKPYIRGEASSAQSID